MKVVNGILINSIHETCLNKYHTGVFNMETETVEVVLKVFCLIEIPPTTSVSASTTYRRLQLPVNSRDKKHSLSRHKLRK